MLKNNNEAAINRLYRQSLKTNRLRNAITILAIVLTTFMFTSIFSIGFSLVSNLNQMQLRLQGSRATVFLENPTEDQIEKTRENPETLTAGIRIVAREVTDKSGEDKYKLCYYDEEEFEKNLSPAIGEISGSYPADEDEIMLPLSILEELGYEEPKQGDKIVFYDGAKEEAFSLSGYYDGFSYNNPILVAKGYALSLGKSISKGGVLCVAPRGGKGAIAIESLEKTVALNANQKWINSYNTESENFSNKLIMIISLSLFSLLIVVCGYLLIYNVMYISVARDIRFYGMLKTIGASSKQISILVKKQAARLAVVGIPMGMLAGTLLSTVLVPLAMDTVSNGRNGILSKGIIINPYIYVFTMFFALITVSWGARKPAKIASRVSPIEALKYQDGQNKTGRQYRNSKKNKIFHMSLRNVFRDRKRCRLVFASLFLGTMMFLCINTFISSLKVENYINRYLLYDYSLYADDELDLEYPDGSKDENGATMETVAQEMIEIQGMDKVMVTKSTSVALDFNVETYKPFLMQEVGEDDAAVKDMAELFLNPQDEFMNYGTSLVSVDTEMLKLYNRAAEKKIDLESFERGEICLIAYLENLEYAKLMNGKSITIISKENGKSYTLEVADCLSRDSDAALETQNFWILAGCPQKIIVSQSFMDKNFPEAKIDHIAANAKKGKDTEVSFLVQNLAKKYPIVAGYDIKSIETSDFKKSTLSTTIIGDVISGILILIGLINFINVMLTGVYTRNNELAILESVGMTKKQIKKMLVMEGAIYGIITIILVLVVGSLMIYGTGMLSTSLADYAVFVYPTGQIVVISVIILLICILVPIIVYRQIAGKTVTERLRMGAV